MDNRTILYGAEVSYFTGKVRAYLRWKGIAFDEVVADATVYREVIVPGVGFPVIPVVRTPDGRLMQDSTDIIDALEQAHPQPSCVPAGGVQQFVARLIELYADEWLVVPAMHYRWHHNREWAIREFGALSAPHASLQEQFTIGEKRAAPFAQAAVLLGAQPQMQPAIESSYQALLSELDAHFAAHPCALGERPCIADFGLYGPLYAHQYRDPASGALMRRHAPNLVSWVERLRDGTVSRTGRFAPDDAVPASLLPVLARMMREQLPVLRDSIARLQEWMATHPDQRSVPRTLGLHGFTLEGVRGERIVRPYSLWMLQRARDAWKSLAPREREAAAELLAGIGGQAFIAMQDPPRLEREGLSVRLAEPQPGD